MQKEVKVVNDSENALPKYETAQSAGMDLRACIDEHLNDYLKGHLCAYDEVRNTVILYSGGRVLIPTGLKMSIPKGYEAQVRPRSGLALKKGITVLNTPGTIDADYRNEIGVILFNASNEPFEIENGDRIAQLVFNKVEQLPLVEVETLDKTTRKGGFGSTGVK